VLIAAEDDGFPAKDQDRIVLDTVGSYRSAMRKFAGISTLDEWYSHLDIDSTVAEFGAHYKPKMVRRTDKQLARARTRDSTTSLSKLSEVVDGDVRIVDESPLIVPLSKLAAEDQQKAIACGEPWLRESPRPAPRPSAAATTRRTKRAPQRARRDAPPADRAGRPRPDSISAISAHVGGASTSRWPQAGRVTGESRPGVR
jgi:hypothetical protein